MDVVSLHYISVSNCDMLLIIDKACTNYISQILNVIVVSDNKLRLSLPQALAINLPVLKVIILWL